MEFAAFVVAVLALAVSVASAAFSRRAAHAAEREAEAAASAERRANRPTLVVQIERQVGETDDAAIYLVRNDGPIDLDAVWVQPPAPTPNDGVRYRVARTGADWAEDAADLGALPMGCTTRFTIAIGSRPELPEFRVRLVSRRDDDTWEQVVTLDRPRRRPDRLGGLPDWH